MKRTIATIMAAACILVFAACGSGVTVGGFSSVYMNSDDFQDAVDVLIRYFKDEMKGCTLERIDYAKDSAVREEAEGLGKAPECVMVLEAAFTTDSSERTDGLESGKKYEKYRFILTRNTSVELWEITDQRAQ